MTWTLEERLLLYCCKKKSHDEALSDIAGIFGDIDWNIFLEKARKEGVSPLVFLRLPKIVISNDIPSYVTEGLKHDYYLNAVSNTLIFDELRKVLKAFKKTGLQVLVLKGAFLAEAVYGNLALRSMSDVDLLVKKEDLYQVDEQLKKLGYYPSDKTVNDVDLSTTYLTTLDYRGSSRKSPSFHIHWHFVNSTIPNEYYVKKIKIEDIWHDIEKNKIAQVETWVMAPHHLIIHLSEHALRVSHSLGKLSFFCDIDEAIIFYRERLDWERLVKDSFKFGLDRMVYLTLYFTSEFLAAKIPEDVLSRLKPERFNLYEKIFMKLVSRNRRFPGLSYLLHLSSNKGVSEKARFVLRTLFPPRHIIAQRCGISPKKVGFIFYLRRMNEVFMAFAGVIIKLFRTALRFRPGGA